MLLKNNTRGHVQLMYPTVVNKQPDVNYVHIPAGATVEIKDEIFAALCKPLTTIRIQREVQSVVEGEAEVKMDKKDLLIKDYFDTGETKVVNLFKEQIKNGDFTVVEHPSVAKEVKIAVLNQNHIAAKDLSDEQIDELYNKLV